MRKMEMREPERFGLDEMEILRQRREQYEAAYYMYNEDHRLYDYSKIFDRVIG